MFILSDVTTMSHLRGLDPEFFVSQLPSHLQSQITSQNISSHLAHKIHAKEVSLLLEVQKFIDSKVEEFAHFTETLVISSKGLHSHGNANQANETCNSEKKNLGDRSEKSISSTNENKNEIYWMSDDKTLIKRGSDDSQIITKTTSPLSGVYNPPLPSTIPLKSSLKLSSLNQTDISSSACADIQKESVIEPSITKDISSLNNIDPTSVSSAHNVDKSLSLTTDSKKKKVQFSNTDQIAIVPSLSEVDSQSNSPNQSFASIGEIFGHGGSYSYASSRNKSKSTSNVQLSSSPSSYLSPMAPSSPISSSTSVQATVTLPTVSNNIILAATDEDEISHNGFFYSHEEEEEDEEEDDDEVYDNSGYCYPKFKNILSSTADYVDEENFSIGPNPSQEVVEALKTMAQTDQFSDENLVSSDENTQESSLTNPETPLNMAYQVGLSFEERRDNDDSNEHKMCSEVIKSTNNELHFRSPELSTQEPKIKEIDQRAEEIEQNAIKSILPQVLTSPIIPPSIHVNSSGIDPVVARAANAVLVENSDSESSYSQHISQSGPSKTDQISTFHVSQNRTNRNYNTSDVTGNSSLKDRAQSEIPKYNKSMIGQNISDVPIKNTSGDLNLDLVKISDRGKKKDNNSGKEDDGYDELEEEEDDEDDNDDVFQLDETLEVDPSISSTVSLPNKPFSGVQESNETFDSYILRENDLKNILIGSLPSNQSRTLHTQLPTIVGSVQQRTTNKYKARRILETQNQYLPSNTSKTAQSLNVENSHPNVKTRSAKLSSIFSSQNGIMLNNPHPEELVSNLASSLPIQIAISNTWSGYAGTQLNELNNISQGEHSSNNQDQLLSNKLPPTDAELELNDPMLNEDIAMYASPSSAAHLRPQRGTDPHSMSFSQRLTFERYNKKCQRNM